MKKINSNGYGGKIIGIGMIFLTLIPALLYIINRFAYSPLFSTIMHISMIIGGVLEVGFLVLLIVELHQDKIINLFYFSHPSSEKTPQQILDIHRRHKQK